MVLPIKSIVGEGLYATRRREMPLAQQHLGRYMECIASVQWGEELRWRMACARCVGGVLTDTVCTMGTLLFLQ